MLFDQRKKDFLGNLDKLDKSRKGSVDEKIRRHIELINSMDDYYTTSSCSGRILLLAKPEVGKKHEAIWVFVKHDVVSLEEVKIGLEKEVPYDVLLKEEGAIFHICCRNVEKANQLLQMARYLGFKRSGIIACSKNIIIEIVAPYALCTPVKVDGKVVVSDEYLEILINRANQSLLKNFEILELFYEKLSELK